jgi:hypothetical protein
MDDLLHIHIPCDDADILAIEQFLSAQSGRPVKFKRVDPQMIPSEQVDVCPMTPRDSIEYMDLVYKRT